MRRARFLSIAILLASPICAAETSREAIDAVVAADGSGDHLSIGEAIDAIPAPLPQKPWTIHIRKGRYHERVLLRRDHVRLVGDGAEETIITHELHARMYGPDGKAIGTFGTPTLHIDADDIQVKNLTVANTAGPIAQALAVRVDGDRVAFERCQFLGWQDTLLLHEGRHYFEDCGIHGHCDFIFGSATAWFERCHLHCLRDGYITAASTPEDQPFGFVFNNCRITGEPGVRTFLGRPWRPHAMTAFLRTDMSSVIRPEGWDNWREPEREKTTRYAEYGSHGAGAAPESRVQWAKTLSAPEVADFGREHVLRNWQPATVVRAKVTHPPQSPTHLRVCDSVRPVGVPTTPYFGWHVTDPDPDEIQSAYRILVASSAELLAEDNGDLWDSGKVEERNQNHIAHAGKALASDSRVYWKVRTWDRDDQPSPWSEPASFVVGLESSKDWSDARWIRRDSSDADDYTYFRKAWMAPDKKITRATAYLSASHKYALHVNGKLVGKGPAYHYPEHQYYNAFDITDRLKTGSENQFAIFHRWFGRGQGRPAGERGLIMKIVVHHTDGSQSELVTDKSWLQSRAEAWVTGQPRRNGEGIGYIEEIDARKLTPDWHSVSFDDSSWSPATEIGNHPTAPWTGSLTPDLTRIDETEIRPASVRDLGNGRYLVDLGKIYAGTPRIDFSGGKAGTTVSMRGGFTLDESGEIDPSGSQNTDMEFRAILNGDRFTFEPAEYLGMRYFQIDRSPMPVTKENFSFIHRHSAMDASHSSFESSNPTLNAVWDLMKHSLFTCAQEAFVDTPTREKGGFLGDAAIQSIVAMPVMNERLLTRRSLHEFLQSMDQHWTGAGRSGRMNAVYPNGDGGRDIPDYTQAYLPWVWSYFIETGDLTFLARNYDKFQAIAEYVHTHRDAGNGLITNLAGGSGPYEFGIVDWPETMRFGYEMTAARTVINGWAYADYKVMANIAERLGKHDDRDRYQERAASLKQAMNARLINDEGVYIDGLHSDGTPSTHASQHANMFPLALGIVPDENRASVIDRIRKLKMSVGMVTLPWLIRAIGEAEEGEHLIELFTNKDWLGWARCLERGATATWESWDADTTGQSLSHAWGAAGLEGYLRYILGVRPLSPQYGEIEIKPLSFGQSLTQAEASFATDRGEISVSWARKPGSYTLEVTLPVNVGAKVVIPKGPNDNAEVSIDDQKVEGSIQGDFIHLPHIGSGRHKIERIDKP